MIGTTVESFVLIVNRSGVIASDVSIPRSKVMRTVDTVRHEHFGDPRAKGVVEERQELDLRAVGEVTPALSQIRAIEDAVVVGVDEARARGNCPRAEWRNTNVPFESAA